MRGLVRGLVVAAAIALGVILPLPLRHAGLAWGQTDQSDLSIYRVDPLIDGAITGGSEAVTLGLYLFAAGAIDCLPRNPTT